MQCTSDVDPRGPRPLSFFVCLIVEHRHYHTGHEVSSRRLLDGTLMHIMSFSTLIAMHSFDIITLLKRGSPETICMYFSGCIRIIHAQETVKKKNNLRAICVSIVVVDFHSWRAALTSFDSDPEPCPKLLGPLKATSVTHVQQLQCRTQYGTP